MLRKSGIGIAVVLGLVLTVAAVTATSNAHFVGTPQLTVSGNTVTASGKVAGLGQVNEIHVSVTGEAACINPGSKKPQAANKESFAAGGNFPVQNGKALFSVRLTATFQPNCTPPMSVQWSNLVITVTAVPDDGTFLQFP